MKFFNIQSGNVLVFILLATGLFAFLTYSLMRSGADANMGTVSKRDIDISLQELIRYSATIESAISQMVLINGVADTEISFDHPNNYYSHANPNCTSDSCKVFEIAGGGVEWRAPPLNISAFPSTNKITYSGSTAFYGHGSDGTNPENADLFIKFNITEEACIALNEMLDIPMPGGVIPQDDHSATEFLGTYSILSGQVIDHADLIGKKVFCYNDTSGGDYNFSYVLFAR